MVDPANIVTLVQHDFPSLHSCKSQLLITTDDFMQNLMISLFYIPLMPLMLFLENALYTNLTITEFG